MNVPIPRAISSRLRLDQLFQSEYPALKKRARFAFFRGLHQDLSPTVLVHNVYVKLAGAVQKTSLSTANFRSLASQAMDYAVRDHLRSVAAQKRGGRDQNVVPFEDHHAKSESFEKTLLTTDLLERLRVLDERKAQALVEKYFNGLPNEQIADKLHVSLKTLNRDLNFAKSWVRANWGKSK